MWGFDEQLIVCNIFLYVLMSAASAPCIVFQQKMEEVCLEKEELLKSMELLQKERDELLEERDRIQKEYEQEIENTAQLRKEVQVRAGCLFFLPLVKVGGTFNMY